MKLLIDMNLSPAWVEYLRSVGIEAVHWSDVGDPGAADVVLMSWARNQRRVVPTHDLDFSTLLASTDATGPSVIQVRTQAVLPSALAQRSLGSLTNTVMLFALAQS